MAASGARVLERLLAGSGFAEKPAGLALLSGPGAKLHLASALPSLTVLDITNEVRRELAGSGRENGLAFVSPLDGVALVRVQERESGFFCDLEDLLNRLVPQEQQDRG